MCLDNNLGWDRPSSFVACLLTNNADDQKRSSAPPKAVIQPVQLIPGHYAEVYFNDALTLALYSSTFARIAFSSSVSIFASRTTGLPLTITSRTSSAFSA